MARSEALIERRRARRVALGRLLPGAAIAQLALSPPVSNAHVLSASAKAAAGAIAQMAATAKGRIVLGEIRKPSAWNGNGCIAQRSRGVRGNDAQVVQCLSFCIRSAMLGAVPVPGCRVLLSRLKFPMWSDVLPMTKSSLLATLAAVLIASIAVDPADAAQNRAWVSGKGVDNANCGGITAPCRQIGYALTVVNPGGVIYILDPSAYTPFSITKSVSIVNDGVGTASIQNGTAGGVAIGINIGASDAVTLRGLNVDGIGAGHAGIVMASAGNLTISNCFVTHFKDYGIAIAPNAPLPQSTMNVTISITDTTASDNGQYGILIFPQGNVYIGGNINHIVANNNGQSGVSMNATSSNVNGIYRNATAIHLSVTDSIASNDNYSGFDVRGAVNSSLAVVYFGNNKASGNETGINGNRDAVTMYSYGNNALKDNSVLSYYGTLNPASAE